MAPKANIEQVLQEIECKNVSETRWDSMADVLGVPQGSLKGSAAIVDRGNDFIALGHVRLDHPKTYLYSFFFFTFSKSPPFRVTGVSRRFIFNDPLKVHYIAGIALIDDFYVLGCSVRDRTVEFIWVHKNKIDELVKEHKPN